MRRFTASIAIALLQAVCPMPSVADELPPVRLGFAGRLSEPIVRSARNGAELAVEEANREGVRERRPFRFELLPQDDQGNANFAVNVANYFVKTRVAGVVGPWSSDAALASAEIYERAKIPYVNFTATSSKLNRQGLAMPFRVVGGTMEVADTLAEVALNKLQGRRVVIVQNDSAYSAAVTEALADALASRGAQGVERFMVSRRTSDFNEALRSPAAQSADVIVFTAQYPQTRAFLRALSRMESKARILLTGGASNEIFDDAHNGQLYVLEYDIPYENCPRWKNFSRDYLKKYGEPPSTYSRYAYNAAGILIDAILKAGAEDGAAVSAALHRSNFPGLSGNIAFDADGNNARPAYTLFQFDRRWAAIDYFPAGMKPAASCGRT